MQINKSIARDDDKMYFTNAAVRDYIKQAVDKKLLVSRG